METYTTTYNKGTNYENTVTYEVQNGTAFHTDTPQIVRDILEHSRQYQQRIKIYYGDTKTGKEWGDVESCIVGRSFGGKISIPLAIKTKRSCGGGGLLDNCIVKITATTKPHRIIYDINK